MKGFMNLSNEKREREREQTREREEKCYLKISGYDCLISLFSLFVYLISLDC